MKLVSIYDRPDRYELLYRLLAERPKEACISHKTMPEFSRHKSFVDSKPYEAWYFVIDDDDVVGAIYLFKDNFGDSYIGIGIFGEMQSRHYGTEAIKMLIEKHGQRRYLANIAPNNDRSKLLFSRLGFHIVQHTYELAA